MHRVASTASTTNTTRRGRIGVLASSALTALLTLSACTSDRTTTRSGDSGAPGHKSTGSSSSTTSSSPTPQPPAPAAELSVLTSNVKHANPAKPVTVKVTHGTLSSVRMTNPAGKSVKGRMSPNGMSWSSTEQLGYSRTYTVAATAQNADGKPVVKREKITTVTPDNMTMPYLDDVYGTALDKGATYGVGMVIAASFDESIPDKAAAAKALVVTTSPHVAGAWYWTSGSVAHWRPKGYYPPGTKVTVDAKVYGQHLGRGLYGQADASTHFVIGAKHYSVADAKTHQVKVYFGDKLVRTMPTSMGQGGYVAGKNGQISLWTMPGIYTVINHENPAHMSSDSYGLPANSPYGYASEDVYWSTKISTDGIYLHQLNTTVWAQGHQNVSHGCLNLNLKNAKWFYNHARIGDVVQVVHSGGPKIQVWQGGDWSVPWSTWTSGTTAS